MVRIDGLDVATHFGDPGGEGRCCTIRGSRIRAVTLTPRFIRKIKAQDSWIFKVVLPRIDIHVFTKEMIDIMSKPLFDLRISVKLVVKLLGQAAPADILVHSAKLMPIVRQRDEH